jgi:hypothetical protein
MRGVVDTSRDVLPGTAVRLAPALVAVAVSFRGAARRRILGPWRFFGASAGESEALRLSGRSANDDGLRASSEVKDGKRDVALGLLAQTENLARARRSDAATDDRGVLLAWTPTWRDEETFCSRKILGGPEADRHTRGWSRTRPSQAEPDQGKPSR